MALDFPTSPTNGQEYQGYVYSTTIGAWQAKPAAQSPFYTSDTPPSNPVDGDSWFNTNDGTMYIYFNDGNTSQWVEHRSEIARSQVGLVPIRPSSIVVGSGTGSVDLSGTVTFTNVVNFSMNNVFSSQYKNYRLVINVPTVSLASTLGFRFRTGSTDNSTNNYYQYWFLSRLTGGTQTNSGGPNTFHSLLPLVNTTNSAQAYTGDIILPYENATSAIFGSGFGNDTTSSLNIMSNVLFNSATSFDGITFYCTAGGSTMTGTAKIYGYN